MNRRDFLKNMMIMAASAPVFASAGYMAVKKLKKPKNLRIVGQAKLGDEVIRNGQIGQIEGFRFVESDIFIPCRFGGRGGRLEPAQRRHSWS